MKFLILVLCVAAASALSADQIKLVQSSFGKVKGKQADILYAAFKLDPSIQETLPQFAGKILDELKETDQFQAHASKIVAFLRKVVTDLPNIELHADSFISTHKSRGLTKEQLINFQDAYLSVLNDVEYNADVETAWKETFDAFFNAVLPAL